MYALLIARFWHCWQTVIQALQEQKKNISNICIFYYRFNESHREFIEMCQCTIYAQVQTRNDSLQRNLRMTPLDLDAAVEMLHRNWQFKKMTKNSNSKISGNFFENWTKYNFVNYLKQEFKKNSLPGRLYVSNPKQISYNLPMITYSVTITRTYKNATHNYPTKFYCKAVF